MYKITLLCLLASLANLSHGQADYPGTRTYRRYGDTCIDSIPCDQDANLACQNGLCECRIPDTMLYNEETLSCRVKAGERCQYAIARNENSWLPRPPAETITMPCTLNATCAQDGTCRCNPYFYHASHSGRCLEKKIRGMACDRNYECDTEAGLVCWQGKCGCNPNISRPPVGLYAPKTSCVGIPGAPCILGECEINSKCQMGLCVCEDGYRLDPARRKCRGTFDEPCTDSSYCGDDFECVDYRCKCKGPNQVFDERMQRCYSIVGDPCINDEDCVPHASCIYRGPTGSFCECMHTYAEFGPGFCRNGYNSACLIRPEERTYYVERDSLLASSFTDLQRPISQNVGRTDNLMVLNFSVKGCDENRKLRCYRGKCTCKDGVETYSHKWGRCVGLAGTLCSVYESHQCVDHADCSPVLTMKHVGLGRCTCLDGYYMGTLRQCIPQISNVVPSSSA